MASALACGSPEHKPNVGAIGGSPPIEVGSTAGGTSSAGGAGGAMGADAPRRPFAAHTTQYAAGTLLPSANPAALDQATRDFYDLWKARYLQQGCGSGRWYVLSGLDEPTAGDPGNLTLSEAHGYGMLISVLMAGHDPDAKTHFDGMVRFRRDHPSAKSPELMAWYQSKTPGCESQQPAKSSTDADLDMALALLMADEQWESCGEIDYRAEARRTLAAIAASEVDSTRSALWVSNELPPGEAIPWERTVRSSDFMPDHLVRFAAATPSEDGGPGAPWSALIEAGYAALAKLQATYAPATGLLPDLYTFPPPVPAPDSVDAAGQELHNDDFFYNACRLPWRIGTHAVLTGDERARQLLAPINAWIAGTTAGDPARIMAGYTLEGTELGTGYAYSTMAFIGPLGVSAMIDPPGSKWLDALWATTLAFPAEAYYEDTLKLLAMIVMSGNWWAPTLTPTTCGAE